MIGGAGPVALVGSGEFLPVMEPVDAGLLAGRARTRRGPAHHGRARGRRRVSYWLDSGARTTRPSGVEAGPADVARENRQTTRHGRGGRGGRARLPLGGDPHHLVETLEGTALWRAVVAAWQADRPGGCSAGAMALTAGAPDNLVPPGGAPRTSGAPRVANGLGLVGGLAVIPTSTR